MPDSPLEMRFDPKTIKHLGVRMYSTLPPAIAEIISNAYDADSSYVEIHLKEQVGGKPDSIKVSDDGEGLSLNEINEKFLVIGRNRRETDGDEPSVKFGRLPTGKKGLGKLALFGLANTITVLTRKEGELNEFVLDWDDLNQAEGEYHPAAIRIDMQTEEPDGTEITLTGLKRKSSFDVESLADSLSRIFIVDDTFCVTIKSPAGDQVAITNKRRYRTLEKEFEWDIASKLFTPASSEYAGKISGKLLTAKKPIPPASGLRGITLFSRGKLVNAPEFFSSSTSSHFYQYLTGWITVDFIDAFQEDVIATNRQSLDWDHPAMAKLRNFLAGIVSQVNTDWRKRRKKKKDDDLEEKTGIDTQAWLSTMSGDVKSNVEMIVTSLSGEDALDTFTPVIKALHEIIPEYPELHWRHLHDQLRDRVRHYYQNQQYGDAASQAVQIYCELIRGLTGRKEDGRALVNNVFSYDKSKPPQLQITPLSDDSELNIQEGQGHLSRGVVTGFRNPIAHKPLDRTVPKVFSEVDCLNVLSLVSYLITRLDNAVHNPPGP